MKTKPTALGVLLATLFLSTSSASSQICLLDQNEVGGLVLHEIDFENLPSKGTGSGLYGGLALPSPLKFHDMTFIDPYLEVLFQPSCEPESDSPLDDHFDLLLSPGAAIFFGGMHRVVILDIQDNDRALDTGGIHRTYTIVFTDKRGNQLRVESESPVFVPPGVTLVGVSAPDGITKVSIENADISGGPLVVTRLLLSNSHQTFDVIPLHEEIKRSYATTTLDLRARR
jgi:hypothetical protein